MIGHIIQLCGPYGLLAWSKDICTRRHIVRKTEFFPHIVVVYYIQFPQEIEVVRPSLRCKKEHFMWRPQPSVRLSVCLSLSVIKYQQLNSLTFIKVCTGVLYTCVGLLKIRCEIHILLRGRNELLSVPSTYLG